MKIKIMVGSLLDKPNNGIYNMQHSQQTIHRAPETYARSDSCKKHKNFCRQAYSFLEVKLWRIRRKNVRYISYIISCKYTVSSIITLFPKIFVMTVPVVVLQLESVRHQQRHNLYVLICVRLLFKRGS